MTPNQFDIQVQDSLWPSLIAEFGRTLNYWPGGDMAQAEPVTGIWKDGAEDEDVSPGRYSRLIVLNSDLAADPAEGDMVQSEETGQEFDVVLVKAYSYGATELTLHEIGATP